MLQVPFFICKYLLLNLQVPCSTRQQANHSTVLFTPDLLTPHTAFLRLHATVPVFWKFSTHFSYPCAHLSNASYSRCHHNRWKLITYRATLPPSWENGTWQVPSQLSHSDFWDNASAIRSILEIAWSGVIGRSWKWFWPGGLSDPGSKVIPDHKDRIVRGIGPRRGLIGHHLHCQYRLALLLFQFLLHCGHLRSRLWRHCSHWDGGGWWRWFAGTDTGCHRRCQLQDRGHLWRQQRDFQNCEVSLLMRDDVSYRPPCLFSHYHW